MKSQSISLSTRKLAGSILKVVAMGGVIWNESGRFGVSQ